MSAKDDMTIGMKALLLTIFVCVLGLFFGVAGLVADWTIAKQIGLGSGAVLGLIFWWSGHASIEQTERLLYGKKNGSREIDDRQKE